MERYFLTFADNRLSPSLARLKAQAESMGCFTHILVLNEKCLDKEFCCKHKDRLKYNVRGFGYWIWKPYLINRTLKMMKEGDQLLYVDAGCHLNVQGKTRLMEYFKKIASSSSKIGGFQLEKCHNERCWAKKDLMVKLGVQDRKDILDSGQICATHVLLQKSESASLFVEEWLKIVDDIHMVDDTPSIMPNFPEFKEHRHDQSVFSMLCKLRGAVIFSGEEVYPSDGISWDTLRDYPIHDKRDKQVSLKGKIQNRILRYKMRIGCLLRRLFGLIKRAGTIKVKNSKL